MGYECAWCGKQIKGPFAMVDIVGGRVFCDSPYPPNVTGDEPQEEKVTLRAYNAAGTLDLKVQTAIRVIQEDHSLAYKFSRPKDKQEMRPFRLPIDQISKFI